MMEIKLRQLQTHEDFEACIRLQKATWGENFSECVPPAILMVAQKVGGVAAGAFAPDGELAGFVFGLTGIKDDKLVNWSHMLAVREEMRGQGVGWKLKLYQRELLLEHGVETIFWTYDPLVARNAHLNLNKLGVKIQEYVPEMYGEDTGSDLHRGIGMDRFIVAWPIRDKSVERLIAGRQKTETAVSSQAAIVNTKTSKDNMPVLFEGELPEVPLVRVEIPFNIEAIQQKDLKLANKWRTNTRRALQWYLEKGYKVENFHREIENNRCFYVLKL